jgi:hypothetical protein
MCDIIVLLDASGSMYSMKEEAITSLNEFIRQQQKADVPNSLFSLYTFSSEITTIYKEVPLESVPEYTEYKLEGLTKLFDCIKYCVSDKKNVVLLIITDGDDTDSETTRTEAKKILKEQEVNHNWQILFIGANLESTRAGEQLEVRNRFSVTDGLSSLIRQLSEPISLYRTKSVENFGATFNIARNSTV